MSEGTEQRKHLKQRQHISYNVLWQMFKKPRVRERERERNSPKTRKI